MAKKYLFAVLLLLSAVAQAQLKIGDAPEQIHIPADEVTMSFHREAAEALTS